MCAETHRRGTLSQKIGRKDEPERALGGQYVQNAVLLGPRRKCIVCRRFGPLRREHAALSRHSGCEPASQGHLAHITSHGGDARRTVVPSVRSVHRPLVFYYIKVRHWYVTARFFGKEDAANESWAAGSASGGRLAASSRPCCHLLERRRRWRLGGIRSDVN